MAINEAIARTLRRRFVTSAGNIIAFPVLATATTATWPFPRTEPDTNYGVVALPNWVTTIAVTTKDTTSLTLTFGTAAPFDAAVDILTFRSE